MHLSFPSLPPCSPLAASPTPPCCRETGPQGSVRPYTIVKDPAAWKAAEWRGREDEWILQLSEEDVAAIEARVAALQAAGTTIDALKRHDDLPLHSNL